MPCSVRVLVVVPSGAKELSEVKVSSFGAIGTDEVIGSLMLPNDVAAIFIYDTLPRE